MNAKRLYSLILSVTLALGSISVASADEMQLCNHWRIWMPMGNSLLWRRLLNLQKNRVILRFLSHSYPI